MSLFSPLWYRIAERQPQLSRDVAVRSQVTRGATWHVLFHAVSGRQCRINEQAYQIVGRLDGQHTVQQIWDVVLESLRDDAPTQSEVVQLLGQLSEQGFIDMGGTPDFLAQADSRDRRTQQRRKSYINPFAFRIPLGDPSGILTRIEPVARLLLKPWAGVLWLVVVLLGLAAAALHGSQLTHHATTHLPTSHYLLLAWIVFPLLKAVHELAHALAVRHYGGEVHEAGVTLFVLTPAPYVDASASARFPARHERCAVAAAGMLSELFIAAVAVLLWVGVQPGLLRDVAFVTMTIAGASTLVFNANPLLRFDGYYVFCDLLDLPNLAARSKRFWHERLRNLAGVREEAGAMNPSPGEAKWLWIYAPSAWMYRLAIAAFIVTWIGRYSLPLGIATAIYSVVTLVVMPLAALVRMLLASTLGTRRHGRTRIAVAALAAAAFVAAFALPLPFHTSAWGVVWLPEHAHVRTQTEGFVARFDVADGAQVLPGQLLVTLEDPELVAQRARLRARIEELQADRFDTLLRDTLRASNTQETIERTRAELARIEERIGQLQVRAQIGGVAILPRQSDTLGTYVRRGTSLGYVLDRREILVRGAVPQRDAALVRERHRGAEVRLAEAITDVLPAVIVRDIPAAVYELPNRALGTSGGGPYATDPADPTGLRTHEPVVHIDLALPDRILERVGSRVWIRFDHGFAPLGQQSYRRVRQVFLQYFDPAG